MRVAWLQDAMNYVGGAELTANEFLSAKPDDVDIIPTAPGYVPAGADVYVVQNCVSYTRGDLPPLRSAPVVKYCHDVWPDGDKEFRDWIIANGKLIFTSMPHVDFFNRWYPRSVDAEFAIAIPPPVNLDPFKPPEHTRRRGVCWVGRLEPLKGVPQVWKWAKKNEPVDFYGSGPLVNRFPDHPNISYLGKLNYDQVPEILHAYEKFIHLPMEPEPFGRSVIEAWAAGCELILNDRVGAKYWIDRSDTEEVLARATSDFWTEVRLSASLA